MSSEGESKPEAPAAAPEAAAVPASPVAPAAPAAAPALREDQIQNAVAFLSHPKVRESPASTKRSFLERKGLTVAEIEEAFRRVPDATTTPVAAVPSTNPATGLVTYQTQPAAQPAQQPAQQAGQLVPAGQGSYAMVPHGGAGPMVAQQQPAPPEPLRWTQVALGVGVVVAGVYAVRSMLFPYAQQWYRSWTEKAKAEKEAQQKQQEALMETVQALKAVQAELKTNSQTMNAMVQEMRSQVAQQAAARALESPSMSAAEMRYEFAELKAALQGAHISSALALQGTTGSSGGAGGASAAQGRGQHSRTASGAQLIPLANGSGGAGAGKAGPGSSSAYPGYPSTWTSNGYAAGGASQGASAWANPSPYPGGSTTVPPPPGGYLGGYNPSASTTSPSQPAPTGSPAAAGQQRPADASTGQRPAPPGGMGEYPPSFYEVMEMVQKGITPPNVRTDINDQPPDPTRAPSASRAAPKPKPWESATAANPSASSSGSPFLGASSSSPSALPLQPTNLISSYPPRPSPPASTGTLGVAAGAFGSDVSAGSIGSGMAVAGFPPGSLGSAASGPVAAAQPPPWAKPSTVVERGSPSSGPSSSSAPEAGGSGVPSGGPLFSAIAAEVSGPGAGAPAAPQAPVHPPLSVLQSSSSSSWKPPPPPARTLPLTSWGSVGSSTAESSGAGGEAAGAPAAGAAASTPSAGGPEVAAPEVQAGQAEASSPGVAAGPEAAGPAQEGGMAVA